MPNHIVSAEAIRLIANLIEQCWNDFEHTTSMDELLKYIAGVEADAKRLDYLERELELEQASIKNLQPGQASRWSVFRQNVPVTRANIDAALSQDAP